MSQATSPVLSLERQVIEQWMLLAMDIKADPVAWAERNCKGLRFWSKQKEIIRAPFECQRTCVPTGHGIGKTFTVGWAEALWILSHPFSYVVYTHGGGWRDIHQGFQHLKQVVAALPKQLCLPEPLAESWRICENWEILGLSPDKPEGMQGKHSKGAQAWAMMLREAGLDDLANDILYFAGTLSICDEASGLVPLMLTAMRSLLTHESDSMMLLGNPIQSDGPMADIITNAANISNSASEELTGFRIIQVSSLDTPNFPDSEAAKNGEPAVPGLASPLWYLGAIVDWPEGTPEYDARILGIVPDQGEMTFFSRAELRACEHNPRTHWKDDGMLYLTCDPARSPKGDRTVIGVRGDTSFHHVEEHRGRGAPWLEGRIVEICNVFRIANGGKVPIGLISIDGNGIGSGMSDHIEEMAGLPHPALDGEKMPAFRRCLSGSGAKKPTVYLNQRSESYANFRSALPALHIPKYITSEHSPLIPPGSMVSLLPHIIEEGAGIQWKYSIGKNQIQLEAKDKMKERTKGKSPDYFDMAVLSYITLPGESAFECVRSCHLSNCDFTVDENAVLHIAGTPQKYDTEGYLARVCWYSRRSTCGIVWCHTAKDGFRRVIDAVTCSSEELLKHLRHRHPCEYQFNVISALEDRESRLNQDLADAMWRIESEALDYVNKFEVIPAPRGQQGLPQLDSLLLATLAELCPEDPYWSGSKPPSDFISKDMLVFGSGLVHSAMLSARYSPSNWGDELDGTLLKESIVIDPLVQCMRLLVVCGAI